jgi:threonine dehydrogenase-like Zn-dependent dehydrogenase
MRDLIAFLGILATAAVLVCVGHVAPADIAVIGAGLSGLFAAWRNRGSHGTDDSSASRRAHSRAERRHADRNSYPPARKFPQDKCNEHAGKDARTVNTLQLAGPSRGGSRTSE